MNDLEVNVISESVKTFLFPLIQAGYTKIFEIIKTGNELKGFDSQYKKYCEEIFFVRTLTSRENRKYIDDFYVPLQLIGINTTSLDISDSTQLNTSNRGVLIKGYAGQGKSTILRKLILNNVKNSKVPIFFELKNFNGSSLKESIVQEFKKIGIPLNEASLIKLLNKSDTVLYLDAFDEALPVYRLKLVDEIRDFINSFSANIVITSRPDDELNSLPNLDEYNVSYLDENKIEQIIRKESQDESKASQLILNVKNNIFNMGGESVFKTPILVSLYTISYNIGEEVPSNLSNFYGKIFDAVFFIHDNLKGRVFRERVFNDNRLIYIDIFSFVSMVVLQDDYANLTYNNYLSKVKSALDFFQEDSSKYEGVSRDIISISNLIVKDGYNEVKFIHKSIAEFFAAKFIAEKMPKKKIIDFYDKCLRNIFFLRTFSNVLKFLEEINEIEYSKEYYIKGVSGVLNLGQRPIDQSSFEVPSELYELFVRTTFIRASSSENQYYSKQRSFVYFFEKPIYLEGIENNLLSFYQILFERAYQKLGLDKDAAKFARRVLNTGIYEDDNKICRLTLRNCMKEWGMNRNQVNDALLFSIAELFLGKYNRVLKKVNHREQFVEKSEVFDF